MTERILAFGDIRLDFFTLDHADAVMRELPKEAKRPATRRAYAQLVHRVMALAVYPCRHIKVSSIPRGWLPKAGKPPAYPYLYPNEDAQLMTCQAIPLGLRLLLGFLSREGCRKGEAAAFTWKTSTSSGVRSPSTRIRPMIRAHGHSIRAWCVPSEPTGTGFASVPTRPRSCSRTKVGRRSTRSTCSDDLRDALGRAQVTRTELFTGGANRGRLRAHDLRATFITLALATGRTETWVQDRTGHTTSGMINRYRRQARAAQ